MTKCQTILTQHKVTLGGHDFRRIAGLFACKKCPLVIDQSILNAVIKKQNAKN